MADAGKKTSPLPAGGSRIGPEFRASEDRLHAAAVPDARGLTLRERQVPAYAALGHSNKVIGYELGLATSTVAGHLAQARAKLRRLDAEPIVDSALG